MFTSKKALYLDNYFGKISPITNIDSLYYELAINDNGSIGIFRKSVVKNMPVLMIIQDSINELDSLEYSKSICTSVNSSISLNIFPTKTNLPNFNHLDFNIFTIDTSKYINLRDLVILYVPILNFNSSIENVNSSILYVNSSLNNPNSSLSNISSGLHELFNDMSQLYAGVDEEDVSKCNLVHSVVLLSSFNDGYDNNASFGILTLYIKEDINDNCTSLILQNGFTYKHNLINKSVDDVYTHYNNINCFYNGSIQIKYIKEPSNGNEIYNNNDNIPNTSLFTYINNLLYNNSFDNIINSDLMLHPEEYGGYSPKLEYTSKNKILYSENISIIGSSINSNNTYVGSNIIINSSSNASNGILITYKNDGDIVINNKIINCNTYNIKIYGSNNLLVNCNNSSIHINGDNNILLNVENLDISINSNTIIINDSTKTTNYNNVVFDNCKFFFGNSVSTGIVNNLNLNIMVFGGRGNNVSIYTNMATF